MAKKLSSNSFKVSVAPESGADATTYFLVPSVTQVKRKADGTHLPEYVSCECFSKTGNGNPVSGGGTIKFVLTYTTGSVSGESIYASRISVTTSMAAISFRLYVGGVKVDEKTVLIVDDGEKGEEGKPGGRGRMPFPSGIWDVATTYTATDDIAPIVLYEPGKTYYVMNKTTSVTGLNPVDDYTQNGNNAVWIPFENYKAIFTEILMANWAKLASAVFFGDYMFSQHGKDASGNDTTDYSTFDPAKIGQSNCPFTPNLMLDLLRGDFRIGDKFSAVTRYGKTEITAQGKFQTADTGKRIVLDPDTRSMRLYDDNNKTLISLEYVNLVEGGETITSPQILIKEYREGKRQADTSLAAGQIFANRVINGTEYTVFIDPVVGISFYQNGILKKRYDSV